MTPSGQQFQLFQANQKNIIQLNCSWLIKGEMKRMGWRETIHLPQLYMVVYDHPYGSQYLDPKVKSSIAIHMLILEARIESTNKDMRDIYDTIRTWRCINS